MPPNLRFRGILCALTPGSDRRERGPRVLADETMSNTILVGAQWGDEGKDKIDVVDGGRRHRVPHQGGNNAGHTVFIGKRENTCCTSSPPASCAQNKTCVISSGVVD